MTSQDLSSLTTGLSLLWGRTVDEATGAIQGCPPFFVIVRTVGSPCKTEVEGRLKDKGGVRVLSLAEYEETKIVADTLQGDKRCYELGDVGDWDTPEGVMFGFFDPSAEPGIPGWPLRNLLVLISVRWGVRKAKVLCYRGLVPRPRQEVGLPAAAAFQGCCYFCTMENVIHIHRSIDGHSLLCGADESIVLNVWLGPEQIKSVGTAFHEEIPAEVEAAWLHPGVGKLGWEPNLKGRLGPRGADLSSVMDPLRLAKSSVRLNIKLMRWSAIPELDVDMLESTKCLLLGAGTLGCAVARTLLGWGVEHITLVDNGRVSYSNPVRQSLYTHQDCLNEGAHKAEAAAAALAAVYPGVRSKGYVLTIPMPGHPPATDQEADEFRRHAEELEALVRSHDVVFVLTDSRESRWLPTLLTAELDKPCINVALGLDSFLVVRHGGMLGSEGGGGGVDTPVAPSKAEANEDVGAVTKGVARGTGGGGLMSGSSGLGGGAGPSGGAPQQLGCYFCTDVVAPENSMLNRTLDQQCTVTRPGLAPMAAAAAVELVVGLLHHPLRHRAPPDNCAGGARDIGAAQAAAAMGQSRALGALPHQVRFFINNFSTVTPSALAFDQCTACSSAVVNAHIQGGWSFIRRVCTCPRLLEEISGLDELHRATEGIDVDLDWDEEDEDHLMSVA
ncbi:unnamed protein product [Choristocarpus tenellus]